MKNEILNEERIATILARADATARGPWKAMLEGRDHSSGSSCIIIQNACIDLDGASDADIVFIANARQDIPYRVSELLRLPSVSG
ncbi:MULTISPECIES: hypothetical protein [unclassified Undibacterium]|uniref:hypothetical protein n=1 Tax=unclassified Undibacterium TaxID=2630295 RepID=UPI002AC9296A|nr:MULTISPECIES: hypothetical protein [unclassified Undibacterium]MEB0138102.1 hypothetical protein [Undibacterium sp. CCC2.1]MEB0171143.1 hypothetical protein [Undibacterium sp. CCC1.1]MEB0175188.1 hypothetical protein [Undibacterium sp. CCC3.4]MEB0214227.1 hypothetical protein [Undibacterium sp. 5I2]WPX41809.1 hypothetical protein RHM61_10290 [Undibacterium sp. CCC3.4]